MLKNDLVRQLEEILIEFLKEDDDGNLDLGKARTAILSAIKEAMPEKQTNFSPHKFNNDATRAEIYGYNQAIEEVRRILE